MHLSFSKYHGSGNDFILIDDRALLFPINEGFIEKLCKRRLGIGADGLILLQSSEKGDFRFRIFNADGKEAAMCGNGIRCAVHFAHSLGLQKECYLVETQNALLSCHLKGHLVTSSYQSTELKGPIKIESHDVYLINTGVPHAVIFKQTLSIPNFHSWAQKIRFHPAFQPEGVNVNLAVLDQDSRIVSRTYERGVEQETLSCGTGAVAVALVARHLFQMTPPIKIIPSSKEMLEVNLEKETTYLTGPVYCVYKGTLTSFT